MPPHRAEYQLTEPQKPVLRLGEAVQLGSISITKMYTMTLHSWMGEGASAVDEYKLRPNLRNLSAYLIDKVMLRSEVMFLIGDDGASQLQDDETTNLQQMSPNIQQLNGNVYRVIYQFTVSPTTFQELARVMIRFFTCHFRREKLLLQGFLV